MATARGAIEGVPIRRFQPVATSLYSTSIEFVRQRQLTSPTATNSVHIAGLYHVTYLEGCDVTVRCMRKVLFALSRKKLNY